jgi:hypothetical protein
MRHSYAVVGTLTIGSSDPLFIQVCSECGDEIHTLERTIYISSGDSCVRKETIDE